MFYICIYCPITSHNKRSICRPVFKQNSILFSENRAFEMEMEEIPLGEKAAASDAVDDAVDVNKEVEITPENTADK